MKQVQELLDKWNDLKHDLIQLREVAKRRTDFDVQDDMDIIINKLNYHVKYSAPRYGIEMKMHYRNKIDKME